MNKSNTIPYDWLKQLNPELLKLDATPLLGNPPAFPWEEFSSQLKKCFELDDFQVEPGQMQWRTQEELFSGLSQPLQPLYISLSSIADSLCLIISENDLSLLMSGILTKSFNFAEIPDGNLREGFYHFIALEVIHTLSQIPFDPALSFHILDKHDLPHEPALCLDIVIRIQSRSILTRLIISSEFRKSWTEHYAQQKTPSQLSQKLAEKIFLTLHLQIGKTTITHQELEQLSPGDVVLLDSCSWEPEEKKGRVLLTLNETPLFRGKLKQDTLKILESPTYYEVDTTMEKDFSEEEENSDYAFEEENEEELEENEEEAEEIEEEEEEEEEEYSEIEEETEKRTSSLKTKSTTPGATSGVTLGKTALSSKEIPLSLIIEVGRLQISVQKLMELQPGNLLELDIKPESGVDLVISGKCIGKGELIRIGETLGVRILDIG